MASGSTPPTAMADPSAHEQQLELYREPLTTPGLVPNYLKRAAVDANPLIEVFQRFLAHFNPGSGATIEKLIAFVALYKIVSPAWTYARDFFLRTLTSSITIPEHDPVAQDIIQWVSEEIINKSRMTTSATVASGGFGPEWGNYYPPPPPHEGAQPGQQQLNEITCRPPFGRKFFWIGLRPFLFARTGTHASRRDNGRLHVTFPHGTPPNSLVLMTPGWTLRPLMDFVKYCQDYKLANASGTTNVYFSSDGRAGGYPGQLWSMVAKPKRKLDTIDMDPSLKTDLVSDSEYYYSEESKAFFANCGIPYRRGYLFYGPPGTGKTSFSAALAGHLGCDLYLVNLATGNVSDGHLHRLFLALPRKCVVVIEDIDSCGIGREQAPAPGKPKRQLKLQPSMADGVVLVHNEPPPPPKRNTLTLSGLLNAIDGNSSAEGRLLIMTSNNPDGLDKALTRPGRIDRKVHFGNMMPQAIHDIFKRLVGRAAIATKQYTEIQIEEYALVFRSKIPPNTFTPAQVQNFLQRCRGDPIKVLEGVDAWIEEARDQTPEEAMKESNSLVAPPQPFQGPVFPVYVDEEEA